MDSEAYKQILFSKTEGFWRIVSNLESEIAIFWVNGELVNAYNRIQHLYRFVVGHFKDKDTALKFEDNFKKIEKFLFDPSNLKYSTHAKYKKLKNLKEADKLMHDVYIDLKKNMINSNLELFYGTPKDVLDMQRRDSNINKVFGREGG